VKIEAARVRVSKRTANSQEVEIRSVAFSLKLCMNWDRPRNVRTHFRPVIICLN